MPEIVSCFAKVTMETDCGNLKGYTTENLFIVNPLCENVGFVKEVLDISTILSANCILHSITWYNNSSKEQPVEPELAIIDVDPALAHSLSLMIDDSCHLVHKYMTQPGRRFQAAWHPLHTSTPIPSPSPSSISFDSSYPSPPLFCHWICPDYTCYKEESNFDEKMLIFKQEYNNDSNAVYFSRRDYTWKFVGREKHSSSLSDNSSGGKNDPLYKNICNEFEQGPCCVEKQEN